MKSKIVPTKEKDIKYPCLMTTHSDLGMVVVLFKDECSGTVVYSERKEQPIGDYSEYWVTSIFKPFYGIIHLTNDREEEE